MKQVERAVEALALVAGEDRCDLLPQIGGSIGSWTVRGQSMLRPASPGSILERDPFGMGSFPLVPYSNRIGNSTFEWRGTTVTLERNVEREPHAIHGVGFMHPWRVSARTHESAILSLIHRPDAGWPWAFEARQHITIADRLLTLALSAINLEPYPVPLSFGHHPYIPVSGAELAFTARGVWLAGRDGLPTERVTPAGTFDFSAPLPVEAMSIDHCFAGWSGVAQVRWPGRPFGLEITGSHALPNAVVYILPGADGFCFEPVPNVTNALNLAGEESSMPVVGPGEAFHSTIRLRAVEEGPAIQ